MAYNSEHQSQNGHAFPSLPILGADEVRMSQTEKYGGFFYLGILGLAVLVGLLGWFGWGVWSLRGVLANVYVLNDPLRSEVDRIQAAEALATDPRATQRQLWDLCLDSRLPDQARYRLARALTPLLIQEDPRGFAREVAAREDWPIWLRLTVVRLLAYAAEEVRSYDGKSIAKLGTDQEPLIKIWSSFAGAGTEIPDGEARLRIERETSDDDQLLKPLLEDFKKALLVKGASRRALLNHVTAQMTSLSEEAAKVWGR